MGIMGFINQAVGSVVSAGVGAAKRSVSTGISTAYSNVVGAGQAYVSRAISQGTQYLASTISGGVTGIVGQTAARYITDPFIYGALGATQNTLSNSLNRFANGVINYPYAQQIVQTPGLSNQTGRYVFSKPQVTSYLRFNELEYSGYTPDVAGAAAPEYIITIRNTKNWVVRGTMQEAFSMSANSTWVPIVPTGIGSLVNWATQLASEKAIVGKWATRRIWTGTTPITMRVNLKFNAVFNAYNEVVRPCLRLQQMALPSIPYRNGEPGFEQYIPLVNPPGPSFSKELDGIRSGISGFVPGGARDIFVGKGDYIEIKIGRFLRLKNIIIKDVTVSYDPKMTMSGHPISSQVSVIFQTYEMMTVEDLEAAHEEKG